MAAGDSTKTAEHMHAGHPIVQSVNIGAALRTVHSDPSVTGIDKRPQDGRIAVSKPAGNGDSGVAGDVICDVRHHGGPDQAVYAYAREDLDRWAARLERELRSGMFGENLTTYGLDVTGALIGERWRIGENLVLDVSAPRIPCRTIAGWLGERGWIKTFTEQARPGTYLRVIEEGVVRGGEAIAVIDRPAHGVTVGIVFRAMTMEPELLPRLLDAETLAADVRGRAARRVKSL
jgi:MOSC domain-containing protein YiiM